MDHVDDVYSVSGCVNENFADYINYWKHNGYWIFDSPEIIRAVAKQNSIDLTGTLLFYYEVHESQFDGERWVPFSPEPSFTTNVVVPCKRQLEGFDVVTFCGSTSPGCSPLSCNYLARDLAVNSHCLFSEFGDSKAALEKGMFNDSEPGPFRIFAVYSVAWP